VQNHDDGVPADHGTGARAGHLPIINVNAVNDQPTLNAITDQTVNEDAAQQTVALDGIGSGAANEAQTLTVTASSSNTALIPNPRSEERRVGKECRSRCATWQYTESW